VIPEFNKFRENFNHCFDEIKEDLDDEWSGGVVADYIPPLAKANPKWFASAFCSTDG
jgi:glutaminase